MEHPAPADKTPDLGAFRKQIDEIDDKLVALLIERTKVVERVGEVKRGANPGQCPLRPGREAEMVRRIAKKFSRTNIPPAAGAAIWRLLIGMSTAVEGDVRISAFAPDREEALFWLAREYFGSFVATSRQPHVNRVIGDIMDGKAAIGVVPVPRGDDTSYWWTNLLGSDDLPKIFARIPFVQPAKADRQAPSALAIARIAPEPSGDDVSLLVFEADQNISQDRMQKAFAGAGLQVNWINIATLMASARHHFIEIKGFVTPQDDALKSLAAAFAPSLFRMHFLGAYATPVILPDHAK